LRTVSSSLEVLKNISGAFGVSSPKPGKSKTVRLLYTPTRRYALLLSYPKVAAYAVDIYASCLPDFFGHVAFGFCVFRLKPREVTHEIVKDENLPVAFYP
jgi:hypothetical protein